MHILLACTYCLYLVVGVETFLENGYVHSNLISDNVGITLNSVL